MASLMRTISILVINLLLLCEILDCQGALERNFAEAEKSGSVYAQMLTKDKLFRPIRRPRKGDHDVLDIFCYEGGSTKRLSHMWSSVKLHLVRDLQEGDDFLLFIGHTASEVYERYKEQKASWWNVILWLGQSVSDSITLTPFDASCVGIATRQEYTVHLKTSLLDPWLAAFLIGGVILFFAAGPLSRNILFYYSAGIGIGILGSLLVIIFILTRLLPFKKGAYLFLIGGWSIALWVLQWFKENLEYLVETHYKYIIGYFVTSGLISFAYCYYRGPFSDPRSVNLVKWAIQLLGLIMIYNGTQIQEVSIFMVISTFVLYKFPWSCCVLFRSYWRKKFPKKRRLLTEDEYMQQAQEETRKALEELRYYCRSPDCNTWKTISRLRTPQRFAKWVEGDTHLSDEELSAYDMDPMPRIPKDPVEEDEIDFRLNSY